MANIDMYDYLMSLDSPAPPPAKKEEPKQKPKAELKKDDKPAKPLSVWEIRRREKAEYEKVREWWAGLSEGERDKIRWKKFLDKPVEMPYIPLLIPN